MSSDKKFVKPCDLELYGEPKEIVYKVVDYPENAYRNGITTVRKAAFDFSDSMQVYIDRVERFYSTGKAHSQESLRYIREDAPTAVVGGCIVTSGILGMALGLRGGRIRRILYGSALAGTSYAVIYPEKANKQYVQLVKDVKSIATGDVPSFPKLSTMSLPSLPSLPSMPVIPGFSKSSKTEETNATKIIMSENSSRTDLQVKGDKGQFNSEDSDMYTQHSREEKK